MNKRLYSAYRLGAAHVLGEITEHAYRWSNGLVDLTRPRRVYALLNERCNLRCQGCGYWRMDQYRPEMSTEEWMRVLSDLHEYLGSYHVNFSGGEPLLRRDIHEILMHCRDHHIIAGLTTNGMLIRRPDDAVRLLAAGLFSLNLSLDGATAPTHDRQRGAIGSYGRVMAAIDLLQRAAAAAGQSLPIVLKPTVSSINLAELPDIVTLAHNTGCSVLFQPISDWGTNETEDLWIDDIMLLDRITEQLLDQRRNGMPVLNTADQIIDWKQHFMRLDGDRDCSVALDTLIVDVNGDLMNCSKWNPIGNARHQTIREVWNYDKTKAQRAQMLNCTKGCTENCSVKRSTAQKVTGAIRLMR